MHACIYIMCACIYTVPGMAGSQLRSIDTNKPHELKTSWFSKLRTFFPTRQLMKELR